jgi:hypothetical protein
LSYEEEDTCIYVYGTGPVVHLRRMIHRHMRRRIHVCMYWYGAGSPLEEEDTSSYEEEDTCVHVYGTGRVVHQRKRRAGEGDAEEEDTLSYEEEDTYISGHTSANAAPERVTLTGPMAKDGPLEPRAWIAGEEDTCMSYEEEDTCMSYEEEDTRMSYEEEDTCLGPVNRTKTLEKSVRKVP